MTHEISRREFLVTASCSLMPRVAGAAHGQSSSSWRAAVTELENLIPQLMAEATAAFSATPWRQPRLDPVSWS